MRDYPIVGKKDSKVKSYHTLNFVERMLDTMTEEELNKYNYSMGVVFKWIKVALEYRKKNVICRLNNAKKLRENREKKIEEEAQRKEDRENKCQEEKEKFDKDHEAENNAYQDHVTAYNELETPEEKQEYLQKMESYMEGQTIEEMQPPTFDEKYYMFGYDEEHPVLVIPDEIEDDKDYDWIVSYDYKEE